jgi:hypothetical protein
MLLIYINRGFFVTPYEAENQGGGELNSVIEWILQLTGNGNDIDEDGDTQTNYSFAQTFIHDFPQQFTQINLFSKEIKQNRFPHQEILILNDFYCQIDQPPESV